MSLRTAQVPTETGDHLVHDHHCAVLRAQRAYLFKEAVRGLIGRAGLEDHSRDFVRMSGELRFQARNVVVTERQRILIMRLGNSRIRGSCADEPVVERKERMVLAEGYIRPTG